MTGRCARLQMKGVSSRAREEAEYPCCANWHAVLCAPAPPPLVDPRETLEAEALEEGGGGAPMLPFAAAPLGAQPRCAAFEPEHSPAPAPATLADDAATTTRPDLARLPRL
jgi:hypothetical protein